jgi:hypothetical protein
MPVWRGTTARILYVLVGALAGGATAWTSRFRGTDEWTVWAACAVAFAAGSGAVFGYGLARWPDIAAFGPLPPHRVAAHLGGIFGLSVALFALAIVATAGGPSWVRGQVLLMLAGIGATPAVAGLAAIRKLAPGGDADRPGAQVERLLSLKRTSLGLLAAVGSLVALATLATGSAVRIGPGSDPATVLVLGGTGSALVGLVYGPAAAALRAQARELCRSAVPLDTVTAADLPSRLDERNRLEQALGVDRGIFADLQATTTILAPLLASAAAVFLPS